MVVACGQQRLLLAVRCSEQSESRIRYQAIQQQGGYVPCSESQLENGFEKIAIYANATGDATNAARQTASGEWTSKLGDWEDIEHKTLAALEGEFYGKVVQILKRAAT